MPVGQVIGRVSVKVVPDTSGFRKEARVKLERIERGLPKLKVKATFDDTGLRSEILSSLRDINSDLRSKDLYKVKFNATITTKGMKSEIRKAVREMNSLASAGPKVKLSADAVTAELDTEISRSSLERMERQLKDWRDDISPLEIGIQPNMVTGATSLVNARLRYLTRPRTVPIIPMLEPGATSTVATTLAALSGARLIGNILDDVWSSLKRLDKSIPIIGTAAEAIAGLSGWALAGASNLFALSASLAQIGPAALALPGIFGGLVVGLVATVAVLKDFNKVIPGVGKRFSALQNQMSDRFWKRAKAPIREFIDTLFPQLAAGARSTASQLGQFFATMAREFTRAFDGALVPMFNNLNKSIAVFEQHTGSLARIIQILGTKGSELLPRLAGWFGDVLDKFERFLARADADGRLQQWIDKGIEQLQTLGRAIADVGGILRALSQAAEAAGGSTLTMFADTLQRVRDVVESRGFQTTLTETLRAAHVMMGKIAKGSGKQFRSLIESLAELFQDIAPIAGRTIGNALGAIFDALDQPRVMNAALGFFEDLEGAVDNLAPAMRPLARALAAVVDLLGQIAVNASSGLGALIEILAPAFERLVASLSPLAEQLGILFDHLVRLTAPGLAGAINLLSLAFQGLALALQPVNAILELIPDGVGQLLTTMALLAGAVKLAAAAWPVFTTNLKFATAMMGLAASQMTKTMLAARGLAGPAGIGMLVATSNSGSTAVQNFGQVASGALLGFAAGGPIGGALGAGAGLLGVLSTSLFQSGEDAKNAARKVTDFTNAVIGVTQLDTTALRNSINAQLVNEWEAMGEKASDLSGYIKDLGVNQYDLVGALMGSDSALANLNTSLSRSGIHAELAENGYLKFLNSSDQNAASAYGLQQALEGVVDEMGGQIQTARDAYVANHSLEQLLAGFPEGIVTDIRVNGTESTRGRLTTLVQRYGLVPKEIETVAELLNYDLTADALTTLAGLGKAAAKADPTIRLKVEGRPKVDGAQSAIEKIGKTPAVTNIRIQDNVTRPANEIIKVVRKIETLSVKAKVGITDDATEGIRKAIRLANTFGALTPTAKLKLDGSNFTLGIVAAKLLATSGGNEIGRNLAAGAAAGVRANAGQVAAEAAAMVTNAIAAANRAGDIHSPSRETQKTGEWLSEGVIVGLKKKAPKLYGTMKTIVSGLLGGLEKNFSSVRAALKRLTSSLPKGASDGLKQFVKGAQKQLLSLATKWDAVNKEIDKQVQKLKELKQARLDYAKAVTDAIIATGDPTKIEGPTFEKILQNLKDALKQAREFRKALNQLSSLGLNSTLLDQIIQAGPEAGLATANAILSGGVAGIEQLNQLQEELSRVAQATGTEMASVMYDNGIQMAQGLIKGLKAKRAELEELMEDLARRMIRTIRQALGIHSPSRVFKGIGRNVGKGFALGITAEQRGADEAIRSLGSARPNATGLDRAVSGSLGGSSTSTSKTFIYNAAPGSSIDSEENLFAALDRARSNNF